MFTLRITDPEMNRHFTAYLRKHSSYNSSIANMVFGLLGTICSCFALGLHDSDEDWKNNGLSILFMQAALFLLGSSGLAQIFV